MIKHRNVLSYSKMGKEIIKVRDIEIGKHKSLL